MRVVIASAPMRRRQKGPKGPSAPRKRRRGQRVGHRRSRGGKPRSNSVPNPAPRANNESSRVVNHKGRKFLWAVITANKLDKLAGRYWAKWGRDVPRWRGPNAIGEVSYTTFRLRRESWRVLRNFWERCHLHESVWGGKEFSDSFHHFAQIRDPKAGGWGDLFGHLREVGVGPAPRRYSAVPPPPDLLSASRRRGRRGRRFAVSCRGCGVVTDSSVPVYACRRCGMTDLRVLPPRSTP